MGVGGSSEVGNYDRMPYITTTRVVSTTRCWHNVATTSSSIGNHCETIQTAQDNNVQFILSSVLVVTLPATVHGQRC